MCHRHTCKLKMTAMNSTTKAMLIKTILVVPCLVRYALMPSGEEDEESCDDIADH